MLAKAKWFNRRRYSGWGLTPRTWQGVAYIIVISGTFALFMTLSINNVLKVLLSVIWMVFILIDVLQVMIAIKLDEREQRIEAIAERNASWTMVAVTVIVMIYVTTIGKDLRGIDLMPAFIIPIVAGALVKGLSNYFLDKRGI